MAEHLDYIAEKQEYWLARAVKIGASSQFHKALAIVAHAKGINNPDYEDYIERLQIAGTLTKDQEEALKIFWNVE